MNRRNFIKASGAMLLIPLAANEAEAQPEGFEPDIVIDTDCELAPYIDVYLDGVKQLRTTEARVKLESFEKPTFGVLVNLTEPVCNVIFRMPEEGEFESQRAWAKFAKGLVEIKANAKDRAKVEAIVSMYKQQMSER